MLSSETAGATVVLQNPATGATRETVTNEVGEYAFPAVDPASYTLKIDVPGFRPYVNPNVRIGTQQFLNLAIVLEVGGLEEDITVSGSAPLIDTSSASHGGTLDESDFKENHMRSVQFPLRLSY